MKLGSRAREPSAGKGPRGKHGGHSCSIAVEAMDLLHKRCPEQTGRVIPSIAALGGSLPVFSWTELFSWFVLWERRQKHSAVVWQNPNQNKKNHQNKSHIKTLQITQKTHTKKTNKKTPRATFITALTQTRSFLPVALGGSFLQMVCGERHSLW